MDLVSSHDLIPLTAQEKMMKLTSTLSFALLLALCTGLAPCALAQEEAAPTPTTPKQKDTKKEQAVEPIQDGKPHLRLRIAVDQFKIARIRGQRVEAKVSYADVVSGDGIAPKNIVRLAK
jgi:hypothetical protein